MSFLNDQISNLKPYTAYFIDDACCKRLIQMAEKTDSKFYVDTCNCLLSYETDQTKDVPDLRIINLC